MIRRYQKGSVRKKNGNYVLRYREDFIKPDGTRGRQQCSTILGPVSAFRGKKDARRAADEIMRQINQNAPYRRPVSCWGNWDRHFKPNIVEKMKRNTRQMYGDRWRKQIAPVSEDGGEYTAEAQESIRHAGPALLGTVGPVADS